MLFPEYKSDKSCSEIRTSLLPENKSLSDGTLSVVNSCDSIFNIEAFIRKKESLEIKMLCGELFATRRILKSLESVQEEGIFTSKQFISTRRVPPLGNK